MTKTGGMERPTTPDRAEMQSILARANAGDPAAIPALRQLLDSHPDLVIALGDLARHARMLLINLAAGSILLTREAIAH